MKTILVTGSNGQLGSQIRHLSKNFPNYHFVFTDIHNLDITNQYALKEFFEKNKFYACINAAAYTAVDKAEKELDLARKLNVEAVGNLAFTCSDYSTFLIHISTDFVFDGKKNSPYKEDDDTKPLNVYGKTKAIGETLALQNRHTIVLRTSWLYSNFGHNFMKTMLRLSQDRKQLTVVNDQIGTPTYAEDLANTILTILKKDNLQDYTGLYHYSNEGVVSWYDFAKKIMFFAEKDTEVLPIPTTQFPTPAQRPTYSVLDKSKIKNTFGIEIPTWEDSLKRCMQAEFLLQNQA